MNNIVLQPHGLKLTATCLDTFINLLGLVCLSCSLAQLFYLPLEVTLSKVIDKCVSDRSTE